jgi:hypothetical protein
VARLKTAALNQQAQTIIDLSGDGAAGGVSHDVCNGDFGHPRIDLPGRSNKAFL